MPVTLDLPPEAKARLEAEAEAARRGITLDELVAELSSRFPDPKERVKGEALKAFLGSGDSGDPTWATRGIDELRREMAERSSEIV